MRKQELREAIQLQAWVVTRRRIDETSNYEVRMDDVLEAITRFGAGTSYTFSQRAIIAGVRHTARDWYGRSNLPSIQL